MLDGGGNPDGDGVEFFSPGIINGFSEVLTRLDLIVAPASNSPVLQPPQPTYDDYSLHLTHAAGSTGIATSGLAEADAIIATSAGGRDSVLRFDSVAQPRHPSGSAQASLEAQATRGDNTAHLIDFLKRFNSVPLAERDVVVAQDLEVARMRVASGDSSATTMCLAVSSSARDAARRASATSADRMHQSAHFAHHPAHNGAHADRIEMQQRTQQTDLLAGSVPFRPHFES